jgi:hypothetical protein
MTAPIASGWSGCRVGLAPTGKRRLSTAHAKRGHFVKQLPKRKTALSARLLEPDISPSPGLFRVITNQNFNGMLPSALAKAQTRVSIS